MVDEMTDDIDTDVVNNMDYIDGISSYVTCINKVSVIYVIKYE